MTSIRQNHLIQGKYQLIFPLKVFVEFVIDNRAINYKSLFHMTKKSFKVLID